jgi:hypothetical protein
MMLKIYLRVAIASAVFFAVLAVIGLKEFIKVRRLKNAVKKGYIKAIILKKSGAILSKLVKPKSTRVDIDNASYFLDETARKVDEYGVPTWIFIEGNSLPIQISSNSPLLNAHYTYKLIQEEAAASKTSIERYFKTILIVLIGIAGLVLLLASGGAH